MSTLNDKNFSQKKRGDARKVFLFNLYNLIREKPKERAILIRKDKKMKLEKSKRENRSEGEEVVGKKTIFTFYYVVFNFDAI